MISIVTAKILNFDKNKNSFSDYLNEKDPFRSLQRPRKRCDAEVCRCPNGRDYVGEQDEWQIDNCKHCNDVGIHAECCENDSTEKFGCQRCKEIILKVTRKSSTNACSRRSPNVDKQNEKKVWKMLPTKMIPFRKRTLHLTNANEEFIDIDPLGSNQRKIMRQKRLDMFFAKADFNFKPPPMPWLV